MTNKAIKFTDVVFQVKDKTILQNITGAIQENKITALVGPSGAGKSTLLKLCNGLISPTTGEIFIAGNNITTYNPVDLRRKVGIALQSAPMIRGTVYNNLNISKELQGKKLTEEEAIQFLEMVSLDESFLHKNIDDISGGERQRISLARTLVNDCDTLLLDEITSALDQKAVHEVEQLIQNLQEEKALTIIWITHDMEQAKRVADDVWVLIDGKLEETGSTAVLHASKNERVQQFLQGGIV
ncbi:MAG TPA: phosphate ABC transporter ATP-binding protein [Pseudogracilibacillus sp.]|nr:phosphate ABC transporter ATP-binding protein [Pseudogracilibacillus sp.]